MSTPEFRAMKRAVQEAVDAARRSAAKHTFEDGSSLAVAIGILPQKFCEEHLLQIEAVMWEQRQGDREAESLLAPPSLQGLPFIL